MFHLAGIILAVFLALLLFTKKGKSPADLILAIWLVLIGVHLLCYYLLVTGDFVSFPYLLGVEIPLPLIHGPFLYGYVATLTGQRNRRLPVYYHLVPAAAAYILLSGFFVQPFAHKVYVYQHHGLGYEKLTSLIRLPIIPSGIIYVSWSLILLRKHRINISRQFSYSEKINLDWLVYLTIGMGAIWLSIIFGNDISTFLLVDVFILFIGYFGIKQAGIFSNREEARAVMVAGAALPVEMVIEESPVTDAEPLKYQKTAIDPALMSTVHQELSHLMQTERLFKDPALNLDGLAMRLGVSSNTLSQVINTMEQRNFYDYINDFRVEEFKRIALLPENNQFTLLSLAFEVGFNSKTSFNRNFKKVTGRSPKEFCLQEKINPADQS